MSARGYTLTELIVVLAIVALMMAVSVPFFLSYWQSSTLRAGAEELVTVLNGARQLAIRENQTVCVSRAGATVRYHLANCGAPAWTGPETASDGSIRLANNVQVAAGPDEMRFAYLGNVSGAGGTYTVLNPTNNQALCVVVAPSGRLRITPPAVQPVCP